MLKVNKHASIHSKHPRERYALPYSGFAKIYDRVMGDALYPDICRSFEQSIRRYGIQFYSAADIGCGTGSFLRYLSKYQVPLYGVDASPSMLQQSARKNRGNGVMLMLADIAKFQLPKTVDLITCNGDTLNYLLSLNKLASAIERCRINLASGGYLLFDMITAKQKSERSPVVVQKLEMPDAISVWKIQTDMQQGVSIVEMSTCFRKPGGEIRRERDVHIQRWYPIQIIVETIKRTGLKLQGLMDMRGEGIKPGKSGWIKFIAKKPKTG